MIDYRELLTSVIVLANMIKEPHILSDIFISQTLIHFPS